MKYSVKEVYYTVQGEGAQSGRPAVFVRFSGCNLWSGLDNDRTKGPGGCSAWCDTDFVGTDGVGGGQFDSAHSLATKALDTWCKTSEAQPFVVCTGGEPLLQLDEKLIDAFHKNGFELAIETNGTLAIPRGVDWTCVSPKGSAKLIVHTGNELKLVFPQIGMDPRRFEHLDFHHFSLQPLDNNKRNENTKAALEYCLAHPKWKLSLQTHKYLGVP